MHTITFGLMILTFDGVQNEEGCSKVDTSSPPSNHHHANHHHRHHHRHHTCISEEESGIVDRNHWTTGPHHVILLMHEEVDEGGSDPRCRPFNRDGIGDIIVGIAYDRDRGGIVVAHSLML